MRVCKIICLCVQVHVLPQVVKCESNSVFPVKVTVFSHEGWLLITDYNLA